MANGLRTFVFVLLALSQHLGENGRRVAAKRTRKGHPPWAKGDGNELMEGDIVMSGNIGEIVQGGIIEKPRARGGIKNRYYLWQNGVLPYVIDSSFDPYPHARTMILAAIGELHKSSCVRFVQRSTEQYFIKFTRGHGCYSYVGQAHVTSGQAVSIGHGCETLGTILHELMHTLGFFHTSSRHDRDSYVTVYQSNIMSGFEHNFNKYSQDHIDRLQAPYDFRSLMHLPRGAWTKNGHNTIESRAGSSVVLGNDDTLSAIDCAQLNQLYSCPESNYPSCYKSIGMENGQIADGQLTSKSHQRYYEPHQARLHLTASYKGNGAWCAAGHSGEWLQVDMGRTKRVSSIATQGMASLFQDAWVTRYKIKYSYDGVAFYDLWPAPTTAFTANYDKESVQFIDFQVKFNARYVRIYPTQWHNAICMRFELYGCDV